MLRAAKCKGDTEEGKAHAPVASKVGRGRAKAKEQSGQDEELDGEHVVRQHRRGLCDAQPTRKRVAVRGSGEVVGMQEVVEAGHQRRLFGRVDGCGCGERRSLC